GDVLSTTYSGAIYAGRQDWARVGKAHDVGTHCLLPGAVVVALGHDPRFGELALVEMQAGEAAFDAVSCGVGSMVFIDD
ncbi:hypothetical protein, partial [Paraburkholderia sp. SIMBA_053]